MKRIIIIGAGGHAAELDDYITFENQRSFVEIDLIGFLDDNPASYEAYSFSAPFLGNIRDHVIDDSVSYLIGIGSINARRKIVLDFISRGANFHTFIHSLAYVSPSASVGRGCVIAPFVNIGPNVSIDEFNLLNSRCSIGHDTRIGNFNFICPNVSLSGFTVVGNSNFFGINSATIPRITVGSHNQVAAGMTLDKNVFDDEIVFFRFKEKVIAKPR